ncbi:MAG: hypothetical protein MZU97_01110 [Bacillus subtilis]|nr:hypothetical protein [Bacillus subtilis]
MNFALVNMLPDLFALQLIFQSDLQWLRDEFIAFLNNQYQLGQNYVDGYSANFEDMMLSISNNVLTLLNPIELILSGVSAKIIVPNALLIEIKDHYLDLILVSYDAFAIIIFPDYITDLDHLYELYATRIETARTIEEVVNALIDFEMMARHVAKRRFSNPRHPNGSILDCRIQFLLQHGDGR